MQFLELLKTNLLTYPDEKRQTRPVEVYANKCFSAFYSSVDDKKTLRPFDVFDRVANRYPKAAHIWLERLESVSEGDIREIFRRIPSDRISPIAARFAQEILEINQFRLLTLRRTLP